MLPRLEKPHRPGRAPAGRFGTFLRSFSRDEDGALLIFGVYVFIIILMVAGIGIDLMRFERDRSKLQYTLDRAVLAAADLDQTLDPNDVVADYFNKAGLSAFLGSVNVSQGFGYRVVSATASAEIETQFMRMTGQETLIAPAASTAEERIDGVEISLILDVSGSMNSNSRLTNLKVAAKDFVDTMIDNSQDGKLSISIIPYATQVALPDYMMDDFNVGNEQDYSNCINFEAGDFDVPWVDTNAARDRTMHFDPWYTRDLRTMSTPQLLGLSTSTTLPVCEPLAAREILPLQKDKTVLKNYIDAFVARGNTSIDVGMKWGTALLDPSMQPSVQAMVNEGEVDSDFAARPFAYDSGETLKVIVLMTDGANTSQYYIKDGKRTGGSDFWYNEEEQRYSVYYAPYDSYYWLDAGLPASSDLWEMDGVWADHPYGTDGNNCIWHPTNGGWNCQNRTETGDAVQLTHGELMARTTLRQMVSYYDEFMSNSDAWDAGYYDYRSYVGSSTKDSRTSDICDAAKGEDIIVYTIGFEAPDRGVSVLADCASSPSHFFDVDGLEISDAFAAIASSIRKLRLTQ